MLRMSGQCRDIDSLGGNYDTFCCRFNVAKTLQHIATILPNTTTQTQVRPCIEKLNNDSDFDVRYYASEAAMGKDLDIITQVVINIYLVSAY